MRLIDKDSLLEQFKIKNTEELKFDGSIESICRVYFDKLANMFIEKAPEIDATPVKHGKWANGYPITCSVCGKPAFQVSDTWEKYVAQITDYCPNCGAKMDLEG